MLYVIVWGNAECPVGRDRDRLGTCYFGERPVRFTFDRRPRIRGGWYCEGEEPLFWLMHAVSDPFFSDVYTAPSDHFFDKNILTQRNTASVLSGSSFREPSPRFWSFGEAGRVLVAP